MGAEERLGAEGPGAVAEQRPLRNAFAAALTLCGGVANGCAASSRSMTSPRVPSPPAAGVPAAVAVDLLDPREHPRGTGAEGVEASGSAM